jgi:hypothetical protein
MSRRIVHVYTYCLSTSKGVKFSALDGTVDWARLSAINASVTGVWRNGSTGWVHAFCLLVMKPVLQTGWKIKIYPNIKLHCILIRQEVGKDDVRGLAVDLLSLSTLWTGWFVSKSRSTSGFSRRMTFLSPLPDPFPLSSSAERDHLSLSHCRLFNRNARAFRRGMIVMKKINSRF